MHVLRLNTILFILGSLCWYMAGGLVLYLVFGSVKVEPEDEMTIRRAVSLDSNANKEELPPIAAFAAVWHTPLQRAVFDVAPPPPPEEVKPEPPRLKAQLMATSVSRGQPMAMFKIPSGKYVTLKIGETFDNDPGTARIVAIDGKEVTLQFEGFEETTMISIR
jgi:hypothetical protein